jgi:flagellar assembly protein FliH
MYDPTSDKAIDGSFAARSKKEGVACLKRAAVPGLSSIIPKEQMTAFERWELASFDPHPGDKIDTKTMFADLDNLRQKARDEGHTEGHDAGYAKGHATGYSTGYTTGYDEAYAAGIQQARTESAQINTLLQNLEDALHQVDEHLAQSLLDLSLEIAHKMTGEYLRVNPEIIAKIVSEAINTLPHFNQNAHLILHPEDAILLEKQIGEQLSHAGWKIFPDARINRGGCRVETANSHVDATIELRWKRIVDSIGQDKSWLA